MRKSAAQVVLILAEPKDKNGQVQMVRLAGGGDQWPYHYFNATDWLGRVMSLPVISSRLGVDENGWGASPAAQGWDAPLAVSLKTAKRLLGYVWNKARVRVYVGPEGPAEPATDAGFSLVLDGQIAGLVSQSDGKLTLRISDPTEGLSQPLLKGVFNGTGDLDGPTELKGRPRRRAWGQVFNVDAFLLDKAANIWVLTDPDYALEAISVVRDRGFPYSTLTLIPPQASPQATLAKLRADPVPQGGCLVAPSIACVRPWTTPGLITADLKGEQAGGYVETRGLIAERILAAAGAPLRLNSSAQSYLAANGQASVGLLVQPNQTTASLLDQLFTAFGEWWRLELDGAQNGLAVGRYDFEAPPLNTQAMRASSVQRVASMPAHYLRKLGYQANNKVHGDGELAQALTIAAQDIPGLGPLATSSLTPGDINSISTRADEALSATVMIADDAVLDRGEKARVIRDYDQLVRERQEARARAQSFNLLAPLSSEQTAFDALAGYLASIPNGWNNTATNSSIDKNIFTNRWNEAWASLARLVSATTQEAANRASWSGVAGRPSNLAGLDPTAARDVQLSSKYALYESFSGYSDISQVQANWYWHSTQNVSLINSGDGGGKALRLGDNNGNDAILVIGLSSLPYTPADFWVVEFDIEIQANPQNAVLYLGVQCVDAAGNNLTSDDGTYVYVAATGYNSPVGERKIYRGYFRGTAAVGAGNNVGIASPNPDRPSALPTGTVSITPMALVNYPDRPGQVVLHSITLRRVEDAQSAGIPIITTGAAQARGATITKVGGVGAWGDSQAYSPVGYTGGAYVSFKSNQTNKFFMVGLNTDPTTDASYTSLDYAWYITDLNVHGLQIYEGGAGVGNFGGYSQDTIFTIIYDGVHVYYFKDGVEQRKIAAPRNLKLHLDSSFSSLGSSVQIIGFGPYGSSDWARIGGAGRPQDNATVGAPAGTLVGSVEAGTLVNTANNAAAAATAAQQAANNAAAAAASAQAQLNSIVSDNVLDRTEKRDVVLRHNAIIDERADIVNKANYYGIASQLNNYNYYYDLLYNYLASLSPPHNNFNTDTPIDRETFQWRFVNFYTARQWLLNEIALQAGTRATWANVSGAGRPQDNATFGAVWGQNLSGVPGELADGRVRIALSQFGRLNSGLALNANNNYGLRGLSQAPSMTAYIQNNSITLSVGNGILYGDWGISITLPTASFLGLAYNTTYYVWRNMPSPDSAGTSYGYSTSLYDALGTTKAYLGYYTTPNHVGGGGGYGGYGGSGCVAVTALVLADSQPIPAKDVSVGAQLCVLSEDMASATTMVCEANQMVENDCCTLRTESGIELTLAINTPITLDGGWYCLAANASGHVVRVWEQGRVRSERVEDVRYVGKRSVARISCHEATYAAGDYEGRYIFTHNNYAKH
jgi:hypothetical protein